MIIFHIANFKHVFQPFVVLALRAILVCGASYIQYIFQEYVETCLFT